MKQSPEIRALLGTRYIGGQRFGALWIKYRPQSAVCGAPYLHAYFPNRYFTWRLVTLPVEEESSRPSLASLRMCEDTKWHSHYAIVSFRRDRHKTMFSDGVIKNIQTILNIHHYYKCKDPIRYSDSYTGVHPWIHPFQLDIDSVLC